MVLYGAPFTYVIAKLFFQTKINRSAIHNLPGPTYDQIDKTRLSTLYQKIIAG